MNFLSLGAKSLKKAKQAANDQAKRIEEAKALGIDTSSIASPNEWYHLTLDDDLKFMEEAMEIGLRFYRMAKGKLASEKGERHYMLTVRPPHTTNWNTFKHSTTNFVLRWSKKWEWCEMAYEQKGETIETAGFGFHVHIIFCTKTDNYYPSHIIRDAKKEWPYVAANCIQCDTLVNVEKARYYIRGDKGDAKEAAVMIDTI